jgi:malonate transporter
MLHVILMALAPVFFVMGLGFFAGRAGFIENRNVASLNALVMNFAVPASAFVAIASAPRAEMLQQGWLFAIQAAVMLLVYLLWYFWQSRIAGTSKGESATQALTIAFPNIAGVALPLVSAILGPAGAVPVAIALAAGSIVVTPLTLVLLALNDDPTRSGTGASRPPLLPTLRQALLRPLVVAPVLGIAMSMSGLHLDPVAAASLKLIGQGAGGIALFLTGLVLSAQAFRMDWTIAGATVAGDIVRPLIVVAIVLVFPVPPDTAKVAILLAAVPAGFFGILLGLGHRLGATETGPMVILSTVFSIATLATAIAVLYPH